MCSPLDPLSCVDLIAGKVGDAATTATTASLTAMLSALTEQLHLAVKLLALSLADWLVVPTTGVCPDTAAGWMAACTNSGSPAAQVRAWLLPITALVAVVGIVWQAITMTITRKGEPLLTVLKGLFAVGLWGAAGIVGTQLVLRAADAYSFWILRQAVFGDATNPAQSVGDAITAMDSATSYNALVLLILIQVPFLLAALLQILLLIFRVAAVIILAGQLQLAAAGGFTRLTSGWQAKVTGWMLALIAYKPVAATIYALGIRLMGDAGNVVMGLAVMIMAVVALPALMRLFNWGVGSVGHGGSTIGGPGSTVSTALHGAAAMSGLGGYRATDHAQWMDTGSSTAIRTPSTSVALIPRGASVASATGWPPSTAATGTTGTTGAGASAAAGSGSAGAGTSVAAGAATGGATVAVAATRRAAGATGDALEGR
jgi:hypothetical protein